MSAGPASVASTTAPPATVACRELSCHFGGVRALDGVSLEMSGAACVAVTGGNGSGKSTLLDLLSGVRPPTGGWVELDGERLSPRPRAAAARGVRRTFQEPRLVGDLSVDENIALGLEGRLPHALGIPFSRRRLQSREVGRARSAVALEVRGGRPVSALAYGERKRVELARLLVATPRVALLDEPLAGVAERDRSTLLAGVRALVTGGTLVVVVEHDRAAVAEVADRTIVLERGRLMAG